MPNAADRYSMIVLSNYSGEKGVYCIRGRRVYSIISALGRVTYPKVEERMIGDHGASPLPLNDRRSGLCHGRDLELATLVRQEQHGIC